MSKKILIIQNTSYHFETTISLYQILKDMNYDVYIYRCHKAQDKYQQNQFKRKYNINTITNVQEISDLLCSIVVSTYPNPRVTTLTSIPNHDDIIFSIIDPTKLLFITHRFNNKSDYEENINVNNALSLSPISQKIGIDHIVLNKNPITPINTYDENLIKVTIQGHLELNNRDINILIRNIFHITNNNKQIILNILGTSTKKFVNPLQRIINSRKCNIKINEIENATERLFYHYLNEQTDWLLCLLTPEIKNCTYAIERYSSTFNHAMALEKPIICDQFFEKIYKIPGLYYDINNQNTSLNTILSYDTKEYNLLIDKFKKIKTENSIHNLNIIQNKIKNLYAI